MPLDRNPERFIRAHLLDTRPYRYVSPLETLSEDTGISAGDIIKLDGNENPYGCTPRVKEALFSCRYYHLYPDSEQRELRRALQEYVGVPANRLLVGAGSDELIDLVLRLFVDPGDRIINCVPTFGMYSFSAEVCGGKVVEVPRDENFEVDVSEVTAAIMDKDAKLVFLASPNNPSGNTTPERDVLRLLDTGVVVVLDEAYCEFSGETMVSLAKSYENLIILRTFSKWAGLAGLRVGYGIFPSQIMPHLMRIKTPYTVSIAAQIAAIESLRDMAYMRRTIQTIIAERQRLFTRLCGIKGLKPYPSKSNFLLCYVAGHRAPEFHGELLRRGISVRYFDTPRLRDCLRISVGKPEHTDALIAALEGIC